MQHNSLHKGMVMQGALVASAIIAFLTLFTFFAAPLIPPDADMRIAPASGDVRLGETFTVNVMVEAHVPVNVFSGIVKFDPQVVKVESINYNTSIADLWAELPWYENGEGTINFGGGTTKQGGFEGSGSLIQITFRTIGSGNTALHLDEARVLKHDGLGTDVELPKSIDAIFAVAEEQIEAETVSKPHISVSSLHVASDKPSTDLNADGKQSIADVSILITNMITYDARYDFNQDGKVNIGDLSILMGAE